jgi:aspartyl-tRNA(Asn)/glutamyl-tRNA(Gln) amidotransferase subunit A
VLEARALLQSGRLSAVELVEACLRRIEAANGGEPSFDGAPGAVNAWVRLYPEVALAQARADDRRLRRHHAPALCGIPIGLKDLFAVRGLGLTASSRVLTGNVARADSVVWRRLRAAGAVLVGHSHTHEFGLGATTDQVGNPWALPLSGGGSSGGSAVALAAGMVPAATGTDTGGSLRFPALLCGISTIKPTRGRVPMHGVIPVAPSLDHAGPMARSVADCAALLQVMGDFRGRLPTKARRKHRPLAGLRVAVTDRLAGVELDPEVAAGLTRARRALEHLGARVLSLRAPERAGVGDSGYDRIFDVEVWAHQRRYADRAQLYRPAIAELVARASTVPAGPGYHAALEARSRVGRRWARWFRNERVHLVLEPTAPIHAVRRNDPSGADAAAALVATAPLWNATGLPVVAIPAGLGGSSGLPVGVSLIGRHGAEATLIRAGLELQAGPLRPPGRARLRRLPAG